MDLYCGGAQLRTAGTVWASLPQLPGLDPEPDYDDVLQHDMLLDLNMNNRSKEDNQTLLLSFT